LVTQSNSEAAWPGSYQPMNTERPPVAGKHTACFVENN